MRILVVSNIYPPHFIGGYELGCHNMVCSLGKRGHTLCVLTSTYGVDKEVIDGHVHRLLHINQDRLPSLLTVLRKELHNQRQFRQLCETFSPDVVFFWNLANISLSLTCIANDLGIPISYYIFDNWLAMCEMDQWHQHCMSLAPLQRFVLRIAFRRLRHIDAGEPKNKHRAIFASDYLKKVACLAGKDVVHAEVLPWGVDPNTFSRSAPNASLSSILYVGQIVPLKGVHTVVEAIGILRREHNIARLSLVLVGDFEFNPGYVNSLYGLIAQYGIEDNVHFAGKVGPDEIRSYFKQAGVLVFPSVWDEPFGITQLEAMASGLIVVGTATGGAAEILEHNVNGLVFDRDDSHDCARQLHTLMQDDALCARLRAGGAASIQRDFNYHDVVRKMDYALTECSEGRGRSRAAPHECNSATPMYTTRELSAELAVFAQKMIALLQLIALVGRNRIMRLFQRDRRSADALHVKEVTLFVALGDSSDLVLAMAFIRHYRRCYPEKRIGVVIRTDLVYLIQHGEPIEYVIPFDLTGPRFWQALTRGHSKWRRDAATIRKTIPASIDRVVSLSWRNDAVAAASSIILQEMGDLSNIIGFRNPGRGFMSRILNFFIDTGPVRQHAGNGMAALNELFALLGANGDPSALTCGTEPLPHGGEFLLSMTLSRSCPIVAIAPGGEDDLYRWPIDQYLALVEWLQTDMGVSVLVVGMERDRGYCEDLYERISGAQKRLIVEDMLLTHIQEILSAVCLLCSNDNVFFYAGVMGNRPVVGIFGPGYNDRMDLVPGKQSISRFMLPCNSCGGHCLYSHAVCLHGLDVERVKREVIRTMRAHGVFGVKYPE